MKSSDKRVTAELLIVTIEAAIARGVGTTARAVNCWRRRSLYSNACSGRASSLSRGCRIDGTRLAGVAQQRTPGHGTGTETVALSARQPSLQHHDFMELFV